MKLSSLFVIVSVVAVAARTRSGASSSNRHPSRLRDHRHSSESLFSFPRVYTAVVPAPGSTAEQQDATYFAAEVDLLEVLEISQGKAEISFLVHNQEELDYLEGLTRLRSTKVNNLQMDSRLTSDLQYQANYSDESHQQQKAGDYSTISGFSCYKNLQGTFDWMNDMVIRANSIPGLSVTMTDIGDSYLKTADPNGGYDIWALKITGEQGAATEKGVFFAVTGIHAREYAPPELASRWAESLIDDYGNNADITAMLDHTEIHLVLQANPDGRQVAETNPNAYQRKNRNPNGSGSSCGDSYGVDLNRNFPFRWGLDTGSSGDQCAETYRGPEPASESEVQAIVQYCESIFPEGQRKSNPEEQQQVAYAEDTTMGIFFDIHSYGEFIIWPWGHHNLETGNDSGLEALANKYQHFNNHELSGPETPGFLYPASGATDDWAYGTLGAAGMTFELGTGFYQDCDYFENSILDVNMKALTYATKTSKAPYSISKGPDVTNLVTSIDGNTLTVTAAASDSAWSSSNHPTSNQGVSEIRVFINHHPYDGELDPQTGTLLSGASLTFDVSSIPAGRHVVYVEATDGDGYKGPVTAAYFTKLDSPGPTPSCTDSTGLFNVDRFDLGKKDCDWLAINLGRFSHLCSFLVVVSSCPLTCDRCELFTFE